MIKISDFLIGLALLYSVGASAAPVPINKMSIDEAAVSIKISFEPSSGTVFFSPAKNITMGSFQNDILSINTADDRFLFKIYSTNIYGAPAPSATVDAMTNTIDVDFSSLRGTIIRKTVVAEPDIDFSLAGLFGDPLKNDYDASTGMIDMLFSEYVDIDIFGLIIPTTFDVDIKGSVTVVPAPAAVWLFGSGMMVLFGFSRKK